MSDKVLVTKSKLVDVADAIREKAGTQAEMTIDEMATAVENLPSGGGSDYIGLEYVIGTSGTPPIDEVIWHGDEIYNSCFYGLFGGVSRNIPISFPGHPSCVGTNAFVNARLKIDWDSLGAELVSVGSSALRVFYQDDCSSQVVRLPKFDGLTHGSYTPGSCFGYAGAKCPSTYYFDTMQNLPAGMFTNCSHPNINITCGSIGHAVKSSSIYPFRNSTAAAVMNITIYTTGEYLDDIKTNVDIEPGKGQQTITYKAAEATTYNGVSYSAGDTILTTQTNVTTTSSTMDLMNASDEEFAAAGRILMGVEQ